MKSSTTPRRMAMTQAFEGLTDVLYTNAKIGKPVAELEDSLIPEDAILFKGIWDTGASKTAVSMSVVEKLDLPFIGPVQSKTANGPRTASMYLANIYLQNGVAFTGIEVVDGKLLDVDFLIGMDIIGAGDFAITRSGEKTIVSCQFPHYHRPIDFVKGQPNSLPKRKRMKNPRRK